MSKYLRPLGERVPLSLLSYSNDRRDGAEEKPKRPIRPSGRAIMWQPVNTAALDLFDGPGDDSMRPDLSSRKIMKKKRASQ